MKMEAIDSHHQPTTTTADADADVDVDVAPTTTTTSTSALTEDKSSTDNNNKPSLKQQNQWEELMGSDLVMRKLITCPDAVSVQPQDAVVVDFIGYKAGESPEGNDDDDDDDDDDNDDDNNNNERRRRQIFHRAKDWLIVIAEKDVVPALELGVRFLNVGETAVIWSHSKFAYGPYTRTSNEEDDNNNKYTLPPHSNVRYRVTVKAIINAEERDGLDFLIRASTAKKDIGNDVYQHEWDNKLKAIQLYQRGASNLQLVLQQHQDQEQQQHDDDDAYAEKMRQARAVMVDCLNNIVSVHLRSKDYHAAKEAAVRVLTVDPTNTKALLRAAKAALLDPASSYEEVQAALDAAAAENNNNNNNQDDNKKELLKLRQEFQRRKQEYKQRSKTMMAKMSKALATKSSANTAVPAAARELGTSTSTTGSTPKLPVDENTEDCGQAADTQSLQKEECSSPPNTTPVAFEWKKLLRSLGIQLVAFALFYIYSIWTQRHMGVPAVVEEQQQPTPNSENNGFQSDIGGSSEF